jgi:hypothetical protein
MVLYEHRRRLVASGRRIIEVFWFIGGIFVKSLLGDRVMSDELVNCIFTCLSIYLFAPKHLSKPLGSVSFVPVVTVAAPQTRHHDPPD